MLSSVGFSDIKQKYNHNVSNPPVEKGFENKNSAKNIAFKGEAFDNVKHSIFNLTENIIGLVGVNAFLWWVQDFVNGKILIGKIHKHYTEKLKNPIELHNLGVKMAEPLIKDTGLKISYDPSNPHTAYYTHEQNRVVVAQKSVSAIFHEVGHAMIENKTKFLRFLQRSRNSYAPISLALYTLISQRNRYAQDNEKGGGILGFIGRHDYVIPLLAFSPELITEAGASLYARSFLRKSKMHIKDKAAYNNIMKSYLAAFGTYLFIPVSIMLVDSIRSSVRKQRQKHMQKQYIQNGYYY